MFQIIAIAIISAIIAIFLRSIDTSLSFLTIIASGIIIIILSLDYLTDTFSLINTLVNHSGVDNDLFIIIEAKGMENDVFYIKKKLFRKYLESWGKPVLYFELRSKKQLLQAIEIIKNYEQNSSN